MKLKPVVLLKTSYDKYKQNTTQQLMLLNALKITNDPKKLKKIAGFRKVADLFRTLDKMALRKEFHKALYNAGIDFDYIINGLKTEAESAEKSADRIKVFTTLLRALGVDTYSDPIEGGGSWEDQLGLEPSCDIKKIESSYDVKIPQIPESEKKRLKEDLDIGKNLYKN